MFDLLFSGTLKLTWRHIRSISSSSADPRPEEVALPRETSEISEVDKFAR